MSKSNVTLSERTSFLEGNLHAIQIVTNEENTSSMDKIKSLESHVNGGKKKMTDLMKLLEMFTVQEFQTLQKTMIS